MTRKKTHKQNFGTHPVLGQSRNICLCLCVFSFPEIHVYLNSVQQMVSGGLVGEGLQTGFSRHGLPPQRAPLDTVYPLREHLNSVPRMVSGRHCEGLLPDTVCWTRLRNTWEIRRSRASRSLSPCGNRAQSNITVGGASQRECVAFTQVEGATKS